MKRARTKITKPTGRVPKDIGAIRLKEVPYNNEWRIQATWRDPDRKKKWFNNWPHAEEFARKKDKQLEELKAKGTGRYTGNDAMDSFLKERERLSKAKDNTGCTLDSFDRLQGIIENHLRPRFGQMRLSEITSRVIKDWLIDQAQIAKPRTVKGHKEVLNLVLNHAADHDMIPVNPLKVKNVRISGKIDKRAKIPDRSDLEALREYLMGPRPFRHGQFAWSCLRIIVLLAVSCGLRVGECSALQWDDIDRESGDITINKTRAAKQGLKGPKTPAGNRKIPTTPAAREIIDRHAEIYKEIYGKCVGPVLRSRKGDYLPAAEISRIFRNAMRECGLVEPGTKKIKFSHHKGRHWCASHWMKSTADIHQTKAWLGHQHASITLDVYGHCIDDPEAREKFQKMPDWLAPIIELDAPSAPRPIALPAPASEDPCEFAPKANGPIESDCPIDVPSIAEPWVKPLIELLHRGMPITEAYYEIMPQIERLRVVRTTENPTSFSWSQLKQRVQQEFRRLKLPRPRTLVARFRAEKICALYAKGYQSYEIAKMAGCDYINVNRVLQSRHKPRRYNPLKRKTINPQPDAREPQPEHKTQLKLL